MVVAEFIDTELWNKIIDTLIEKGWEVTYQYDGMDAGIDYNKYILMNSGEEIKFEWTNWEEGEIHCSMQRLRDIETMANIKFAKIKSDNKITRPGEPTQ